MKNFLSKIIIFAVAAASFLPLAARQHEPYNGSRIYWDISSKKMLFTSGTYARIIELNDGRLLAVAESGGGISIAWSENRGESWSPAERIVQNASQLPYAVPDVIQLKNGDIVVGFNPRPSQPYSPDRRFGIRCVRSTDNGKTWSAPIFIYDAMHEGNRGCWEPCFLELPSGELQCYFANEKNFPNNNDQEISMCRSFDGGLSWGEEVRISYSIGSRDGMPVPILTEKNEIVVIIEDNGWGSYGGFRATTVRCPLEDNWSNWVPRNSVNRQMVFANADDKAYVSAAPYIRKFGTDETIVSWQGDRGSRKGLGENFHEMSVGVGDANGYNVKAIVSPFGLPTNQSGKWNSVTALDDGTIFAMSSIGEPGKGSVIYVMTGYAMKGFEAAYGTPVIDGSSLQETWTKENACQVYMGSNSTRNLATMDFLYDDTNLYFFARVTDHDIFTDKADNDGITLAFDVDNVCDNYPQKGVFRLFLDANGSLRYYTGDTNKWVEGEAPAAIDYAITFKRSYYEMEVAVPWSALGCEVAPVGKNMRCYIEINDRHEGDLVKEIIPESNLSQSWTWPEFKLLPGENGGIGNVVSGDDEQNTVKISYKNGNVSAQSARGIAEISLYSVTGVKLISQKGTGCEATVGTAGISGGVYIVEARDASGNLMRQKLIFH